MPNDETLIEKDENLQEINQEIYKRNIELAVVNKTLSLLRKLYQITLLELDPATLSKNMSDSIRIELNIEMTGILSYDQATDSLNPFSFSKSDRFLNALKECGITLKNIPIHSISNNRILKEVVYAKISAMTSDINDIWHGLISEENTKKIADESHIKNIVLYPLVTPSKVVGVLMLGLNRQYNDFSEHERDAMKSFIDVVAVALEKAYLYKELQDANEKLKGLDQLKTEFLSLASHQLRSPLTAIKGYTSMVLEGDFGEINKEAHDAIDRVFQSTLNLMKIVEDLLNVSKIEQGGMKYEMAPFNLCEVSSDMAKDLSIVAEKKGVKLTFESGNENECMVNGDKEKMRQVVLNFIDNSIKYTKEGSIAVSVKKIDKKIVFTVKDTGMGMTPEIKETLFAKFARGDGARMNTGGSGLGLYLAKQIVEAHKGKVTVESDGPGKGSTFMFEMDAIEG